MDRLRFIVGIDLRTLAFFRAGAACILLADLAIRACDLSVHYSDGGLLPRSLITAFMGDRGPFSVHMASGDAWFQAVLFCIAAWFALLLLIGYRTRLVCIVSWLLLSSLQLRNPMILSGADLLLAVLLFWGMFLPLGARWSVDAALDPRSDRIPNLHCSVASAAMLVQVMSVYFFTAFLKSGPEWWPDGTAVYYALHIDMYVTPLGTQIRDWPLLLQGLTWLVLALEFVCPILVFSPLFSGPVRLVCIGLLAAMHIGFELFLELGLFPHTSLLSLSLFIPGFVWSFAGQRGRPKREALRIYYDPDCEFCRKISLVLAQLMVLPSHRIVRSAAEDASILARLRNEFSWIVVDGDGETYNRYNAFLKLLHCSPLWFWTHFLLATAPFRVAGDFAYGWIARHREGVARCVLPRLRERPIQRKNPLLVSAVAVLFALLVLQWNLQGLPQTDWEPFKLSQKVLRKVRLEQRWAMFAPYPSKTEGWYVIPGKLEDGTTVDVYHQKVGEPDTRKPRYLSEVFPTYRWRKYLNNLRERNGKVFRQPYARYLCRSWNDSAIEPRRLKTFEIVFFRETTLPDYAPPKVERKVLWVHDCLASAEEMRQRQEEASNAAAELSDG